ncbi:protein CEBPZOS isoform X3 [Rana temporaria]|nr:protein CEBPZOS isoform X3 [Rana temporaria]XP_040206729.1 protein CEBPZOS isoform X3 [Rana temporaria]
MEPIVKKVFKGLILLELAGLVGVYVLYHKMDSSQDFRYTMNRRLSPVLEAYYKSNEWAGIHGKRENDAQAWSAKTN